MEVLLRFVSLWRQRSILHNQLRGHLEAVLYTLNANDASSSQIADQNDTAHVRDK